MAGYILILRLLVYLPCSLACRSGFATGTCGGHTNTSCRLYLRRSKRFDTSNSLVGDNCWMVTHLRVRRNEFVFQQCARSEWITSLPLLLRGILILQRGLPQLLKEGKMNTCRALTKRRVSSTDRPMGRSLMVICRSRPSVHRAEINGQTAMNRNINPNHFISALKLKYCWSIRFAGGESGCGVKPGAMMNRPLHATQQALSKTPVQG